MTAGMPGGTCPSATAHRAAVRKDVFHTGAAGVAEVGLAELGATANAASVVRQKHREARGQQLMGARRVIAVMIPPLRPP